MKHTHLSAIAAAGLAATLLAACGDDVGSGSAAGASAAAGGGGNDSLSCTNEIQVEGVPQVTVWAWYPNMETVVDNFNSSHEDVQVCWTNAGQGNDQYDKFQTAIAAGTGAPDVVMLESDRIPNYVIQDALVDISGYGYEDVQANFSEGAWKDVSVGDAVYAAPVDGGPMAMIYRTDVFEQYGVTPPTTWEEYEAAARAVKDAGGPLFGDFGANVPAVVMALQIQAGAQPFEYDPANPTEISVALDDPASVKVLDYWAGLVQDGLVGTQDQFTPEYISGVVGGDYATYVSAAWAPGYLSGAGVGEGADAGTFAVAPLPQWEGADPVSVNWGGSAFAVTTQAADPELAAGVAFDLYADEESLTDGWQNQVIFPLNQDVLTSAEFVDYEVGFFDGQQANKEVYVPAADAYEGFTYAPFGQFYYQSLTEQIAAINAGEVTGAEAAAELQETVTAYAEEQGFTVTD
ncbi:ABC transporter substrate-binding protein [Aquipuribacter hungaricus]|uniref:ABC transporter substrate-binding protein n=1 Tax=Aquipuribacter hungaricus TaxID=545624 RepID=A0ABV7WG22_9MICO